MTIEQMENRIQQLSIEIVMGAYYDGWTLKGMKEEVASLKGQIKIEKTKRDVDNSLLYKGDEPET